MRLLKKDKIIKYKIQAIVFLCFIFYVLSFALADAAIISLSPSSGAFTVGSTFDISLFLNTQEKSVNAVQIYLKFPSDKLQLVSPKISQSIINIWSSQPKLDNKTGVIELEGIIPGGINTSNGLITKFTFRVKSVGSAIVKFLDKSRVLLNDGLGTDALEQAQNSIYSLVLPPPAGPIVVSETHPDQSRWYSNQNLILKWASESEVDGYSYILNNEPIDIPDDISDGVKNSVIYKNIGNGVYYFHIKSLRNGGWGGVTHFSVNIDSLPPAEFSIEVSPSVRSTSRQPIIQFMTTDSFSGLDHYELKIISLQSIKSDEEKENQQFFIEAESPYLSPMLELGSYDIIIRAYDKAGNYRETIKHLNIVNPFLKPITDKGLEIDGLFIIPWLFVWIISVFLIVIITYVGWRFEKWHHNIHFQILNRKFPEHIEKKLDEFEKYRSKYKGVSIFLIIISAGILFSGSVFAQETESQKIEFGPPVITTISRNISNEEIFYIGGKTDFSNTKVIIYLQNPKTGETLSQGIVSDKNGDWLYRHNAFLSSGNYILWAQSKIDEQLSPPSAQMQINVQRTAIQFGASRISYEVLYLIIIVIFLMIFIYVISRAVFHAYHAREKHKEFTKEIKEAEESIRRGFAVLRRDIEAELAVIKKVKLNKNISAEEKNKEDQLIKDINLIESYIGKEIWDIKKTEYID
ncbi:MAG: cohesin domain-containing protein [Patescibacteria group bacterium]